MGLILFSDDVTYPFMGWLFFFVLAGELPVFGIRIVQFLIMVSCTAGALILNKAFRFEIVQWIESGSWARTQREFD